MCNQSLVGGGGGGGRRSPGGRNGNPLQYSCQKNSTDRGAWLATVHGVTKSWTQLSDWAHRTALNHIYYFTQARILELFAISFPRRSSWQRGWTWVSHIAGRFFTISAGSPLVIPQVLERKNTQQAMQSPRRSWRRLRKQEEGGNHG